MNGGGEVMWLCWQPEALCFPGESLWRGGGSFTRTVPAAERIQPSPFGPHTCAVFLPSPPLRPLQAALTKGLVSAEEVEAAVETLGSPRGGLDGGLDLAELLYDQQAAQLIHTPVQVVAFSDEEGVR